jgi:hypothetical protein
MRSFMHLILLVFSMALFASSLPYIEHVDGHPGYRKNASGHFVFDGEMVPTGDGNVILPTPRSATEVAAKPPVPATHPTISEHRESSSITRRTQDEPPSVTEMRIWLRIIRQPQWDGTECVFWDDRITDEDWIDDMVQHSMPNGHAGHWFKELYGVKADDWGRPGFPTHNHPAHESLLDKDPQLMPLMMQALAEVSVWRIFILRSD